MNSTLKNNIINKINNLQEIIKNVIRSNHLYKNTGFLKTIDLNSCVIYAESIYFKLDKLMETVEHLLEEQENDIINKLQNIIEEISTLISLYGCDTLDSLIMVCIGSKYIIEAKYSEKYKLLNNYFSPLHYKTVDWNKSDNFINNEETIVKKSDNFECFNIDSTIINNCNINFQNSIYGMKIVIHNIEKQHTIIVHGIMEDINLDLINDKNIKDILKRLADDKPIEYSHYNEKSYIRFIKCLTLKDILVFSIAKLKDKYTAFIENFVKKINKKSLLQIINEFMDQELINKRKTLMTLLISSEESDNNYLAYLLYDLLSNDTHGMIDTFEQTTIYDSLPLSVKKYFRDAMKNIITYTNKLSKIDSSKISLEQRICLLKTDDIVKEKAMVKLKEVKLKSEDAGSGSKAMHYLDGLLKIPFGIFKEEQILQEMPEIISLFNDLIKKINNSPIHIKSNISLPFTSKTNYTSIEIYKYLPLLKNSYNSELYNFKLSLFKTNVLPIMKKKTIINIYNRLNSAFDYKGKTLSQLRTQLLTDVNENILNEYVSYNDSIFNTTLVTIENKINNINVFMKNMAETLNQSVYGHNKAKRQIERIIGQWINGDLTGYCFGFEGPPGVGKTSLAKNGIANCLKDDHGVNRPFAFIAMGGSTNSSTLDGHNYTYVGSTWGRIVDILMDTKIMNPIIFIDELDKISKTENGKEIIGILTHLIDQTQNDTFQDKYFNGVNLNLSKALFIFSYNDVEIIDKILLDRIHRIKFEHLTNDDKLIISRKFILPEIYKKMGLIDMIEISDEVIEYIIENYTAEPGVRKLKELMFEIVGEINLSILKNDQHDTAAIMYRLLLHWMI
jgi:ATP-dependent Lon protease